MIVKGVQCGHCQDVIWSRNQTDFRYCRCSKTFINGGREFLSFGGEGIAKIVDVDTEAT